jgi:hypothetical protein
MKRGGVGGTTGGCSSLVVHRVVPYAPPPLLSLTHTPPSLPHRIEFSTDIGYVPPCSCVCA